MYAHFVHYETSFDMQILYMCGNQGSSPVDATHVGVVC